VESRPPVTRVPPLPDGACQVWWARPSHAGPGHDAVLDTVDLERRSRLRRAVDRDRLTVAYTLVRLILASHLEVAPDHLRFERTCRTCGGPHGKPTLPPADDGGLRFSLSHAGDRVMVGVCRGIEIGVDVEAVTPDLDIDGLIGNVLSDAEAVDLALVEPADRVRAFLRYWTRKEAILKATGDGLRTPMTDLTLSGPDLAPRLLNWAGAPDAASRFHLHDPEPDAGHISSLSTLDHRLTMVTEFDGAKILLAAS
jgi:4'-phosphopantetheinyl transferase